MWKGGAEDNKMQERRRIGCVWKLTEQQNRGLEKDLRMKHSPYVIQYGICESMRLNCLPIIKHPLGHLLNLRVRD